jgi:hypothetical protein
MRLAHQMQSLDSVLPKLYTPNPAFIPHHASINIEKFIAATSSSLINSIPSSYRQRRDPFSDITLAFKSLCLREDVRIESTDKNLGPILVDSTMSINFTLEHLLSPTFTELSETEATEILVSFMDKVKSLMEKHSSVFKGPLNRFITAHFSPTPKPSSFKILFKIHKIDLGTRPILASTTFVTTNLSKWIDKEVSHWVSKTGFILRDSLHLIDDIKSMKLNTPTIMLTADVKALYPSIPIDEGIRLFKLFLELHTTIPRERRELIIIALTLVLKHNVTTSRNRFFLQVIGTAMGTPCAVVFANVFMFMVCKDVRNHRLVIYFRRFIDDLFLIAHYNHDTTSTIFSLLNNLHPSIKFPESDFHHSRTTVNILDLTVYRPTADCNTLSYKLFTKPCNRFLYIPFYSFHTKATIKGFIKGELHRFASHSSTFINYNLSANLFFTRLVERDYPPSFLLPIFDLVSWPLLPKPTSTTPPSTVPLLFHTTNSPLLTHSALKKIFEKHWHLIESDFHGSYIFPEQPLICWKNPPSFQRKLNSLQARLWSPPVTHPNSPHHRDLVFSGIFVLSSFCTCW